MMLMMCVPHSNIMFTAKNQIGKIKWVTKFFAYRFNPTDPL